MNERYRIERDGKSGGWMKRDSARGVENRLGAVYSEGFTAINCHSNDSCARLKLGRPSVRSPSSAPSSFVLFGGGGEFGLPLPFLSQPPERGERAHSHRWCVHVLKQDGEASIREKKEGKKTAQRARGEEGRIECRASIKRVRTICRSPKHRCDV